MQALQKSILTQIKPKTGTSKQSSAVSKVAVSKKKKEKVAKERKEPKTAQIIRWEQAPTAKVEPVQTIKKQLIPLQESADTIIRPSKPRGKTQILGFFEDEGDMY